MINPIKIIGCFLVALTLFSCPDEYENEANEISNLKQGVYIINRKKVIIK